MATLAHCSLPSKTYFEAFETAERRALHSDFDQHIVEDRDLGYYALDERDYNALPGHLASRVVHTVRSLSCIYGRKARKNRYIAPVPIRAIGW